MREGILPFGSLWNLYQNWESAAVSPPVTSGSGHRLLNQIAYGYGYFPLDVLLPGTVQFAQTFYPNMRFGLALALMDNGFFT